MSRQYEKAGVSIDAGNRFIDLIRPAIKKTHRQGVLADIGGYGGLFALDSHKYKEPVLVSSTDGVGTKLKLAVEQRRYDTIGTDLVAMCVNDIACCGAEPLFFLDYFAMGRLIPEEHKVIVAGIADACRKTGCALIGGETAEMPDLYNAGDFDLAGFAVGVVERKKIIDGTEVRADQTIIGIASSGFHSNGYALVRKIVRDNNWDLSTPLPGFDKPLGEMLLEPTRLYSPVVMRLIRDFKVTAIAHITGGGFTDNIPRVLPAGIQAWISKNKWPFPPIMKRFQEAAEIDEEEMFRVFNCGIGLIIIVPADQTKEACDIINALGEKAFVIGSTRLRETGSPPIVIE
jgi:phosphoribosylformylglycinamidine cyclo-ligase